MIADAREDAAAVVDVALDRYGVISDRPFTWRHDTAIDLYAKAMQLDRVLRVGLPERRAVRSVLTVPVTGGPCVIRARRVVTPGGLLTPEQRLLDETGVDRLAQALQYFAGGYSATLVAVAGRGGAGVCLSMLFSDGGQLSIVVERGAAPRDDLTIMAGDTAAWIDLSAGSERRARLTQDGATAVPCAVASLATCRRWVLADALQDMAGGVCEIPRDDVVLLRTVHVARGSLLLAEIPDAVIDFVL